MASLVRTALTCPHAISVCLPARNEAATIGAIVARPCALDLGRRGRGDRRRLDRRHRGRRTAARAPGSWPRRRSCPRPGRDRARATRCGSRCYECRGDIICWLDADLRNFRGEYIERAVRAAARRPRHDVREGVLHTLVRRRADRRRPRHRARRPAAALAAVPEARRHRAAARRRVRGAAQRARSAAVRRRLGRRARVARSTSSSASAATRSRRSTSDVREHRNRPLDELGRRRSRSSRPRCDARARSSDAPFVELLRAARRYGRRATRSRSASGRRSITVPAYRARFAPASIAASSTSSAARVYASLACHTRSVSASTSTSSRSREFGARVVGRPGPR